MFIFLILEFSLAVFFYSLCNKFPIIFTLNKMKQWCLQLGSIFLTINFIAFDFTFLSDLNSNPNNLVEILIIRVFLVDCSICLNISLIALKISNSSLSGSFLINLQPSSWFIAFYLFISWSMFLSLFPFSSFCIAVL